MNSTKQDLYARITSRIVADLEQGVRPWVKPWSGEHLAGKISRPLRHNGVPYRGINVVTLWVEAVSKGFASPMWLTFKQAQELGAHVKKGEHGSLTVYADRFTKTDTSESGEETERSIPFLKSYTVFNAEQCEGLPAHYYAAPSNPLPALQRHAAVEAFTQASGAEIRHGGTRAYYNLTQDFIQLPPFETFKDAEGYYATSLHELTHWTMHGKRLNRDFGRKRWGDEAYAMEELVAELGAAFLCADTGITPEVREDHASYLAHWLKVLKEDKRAIFTAAAHAQRAADYLAGLHQKAGTLEQGAAA